MPINQQPQNAARAVAQTNSSRFPGITKLSMPLFTGRIYAIAKKVVIPARSSVMYVDPRLLTSKGSDRLRCPKLPGETKVCKKNKQMIPASKLKEEMIAFKLFKLKKRFEPCSNNSTIQPQTSANNLTFSNFLLGFLFCRNEKDAKQHGPSDQPGP